MHLNRQIANSPSGLTAPCWISISRLVLLPLALWSASDPWPMGWLIAAKTCAVAALTDVLDGYVARRTGSGNPLSSSLDLLADKLFVAAMTAFLAIQGAVPFWVPAIIIAREVIVSLLRIGRYRAGLAFSPNWLGKAKMAASMGAMVLVLLREDVLRNGASPLSRIPGLSQLIVEVAWWSVILAVALTLVSGLGYLVAYWPKRSQPTGR